MRPISYKISSDPSWMYRSTSDCRTKNVFPFASGTTRPLRDSHTRRISAAFNSSNASDSLV